MAFQGLARQKTFLDTFNGMPSASQKALKDIYCFANHGRDADGRHVVMAMTSAARFPEIFRLVIMNIVVRLQIKHNERVKNREKAARLRETLEDFHVALDAFMNPGLSLVEAARLREERISSSHIEEGASDIERLPLVMYADELSRDIHHFKRKARPTVERIKTRNRNQSPPES